jgi:hypothetical protein
VTPPGETPPGAPTPYEETDTSKPLPLQLDLPSRIASGTAAASPRWPGHTPRRRARVVGVVVASLVILGVVAGGVGAWALPWYVRRQCVETAAEHGVELSVESVRVNTRGFRLLGVHAVSADVPGASAQVPEVDVETGGLRPQTIVVRGGEVSLSGRFAALDGDVARWRASPSGGQGGAWTPAAIVIEGARVMWQGPFGDATRVDAHDVHAEVTWRGQDADPAERDVASTTPRAGLATEVHLRSDHVTVTMAGHEASESLGPWHVDIDRSPGSSRVRVAFDPGVPEESALLIVGDGERTTSIDVVVPRSPLARLGAPAPLLDSNGEGLQLEANIHYVSLGPGRAYVTSRGGLYGLRAPLLARALDAAWNVSASGDPSAGIDVKKARLAIGPLIGPVTGTLKTFEDGFRIDLAWTAGPVPCAALTAQLGLGQPFDIGNDLRKIADAAGGTLSATLGLSFDSRNPGAARLQLSPEIGCALTLPPIAAPR